MTLALQLKQSKTFHFADDTCFLKIKSSVKHINTIVNKHLKFLVQWLNANRIALNVAKTEVIFGRKKTHSDCDMKLKLCGKNLSYYIRYLGIYLDEHRNCSLHINHLSQT